MKLENVFKEILKFAENNPGFKMHYPIDRNFAKNVSATDNSKIVNDLYSMMQSLGQNDVDQFLDTLYIPFDDNIRSELKRLQQLDCTP